MGAYAVALSRATLALTLAFSVALAGGCGFRLRGSVDVPPELNPLFVKGPPGSLVQEALAEQLAGSAVELAQSESKARLILRIASERSSSRVAATDNSAKVLAYDLHFDVTYDVVTPSGQEKLPTQRIELVRTFDNPDVEVLGKQLEEDQIYRELAVDAADRILMRMRTALRAAERNAWADAKPKPGPGAKPDGKP